MNGHADEVELLRYFSMLNETEQHDVLKMCKAFIARRKEEDVPLNLEQYSRELEEADDEIERGEYISHDDVKRRLLK